MGDRLRTMWIVCGLASGHHPARRLVLFVAALVVGGLGGEVLVLSAAAHASPTVTAPTPALAHPVAAAPPAWAPRSTEAVSVPAEPISLPAVPPRSRPDSGAVGTDARLTFPAATTPDIAEVSELRFEVSRVEFSLANLDGTLIVLDGSRFRLDADVLFRFDRADVSPKAAALIADVASQLRNAKARAIRVDGYTDDAGDAGYNLGLSRRRAAAVADTLGEQLGSGVTMRVTGHGEADPVADNDTEAGRARNRRVTVSIVR